MKAKAKSEVFTVYLEKEYIEELACKCWIRKKLRFYESNKFNLSK